MSIIIHGAVKLIARNKLVARESQPLKDIAVLPRSKRIEPEPVHLRAAMRTAFVARFIVLREGRRSRAHRAIENLFWTDDTSAEELAEIIRQAFIANGDKLQPVDRDIRRALEHARCSVSYFIDQYRGRSTLSFNQALEDYERSNRLLFGEDPKEVPRSGGWRVALA